jgi:hypothetical protein
VWACSQRLCCFCTQHLFTSVVLPGAAREPCVLSVFLSRCAAAVSHWMTAYGRSWYASAAAVAVIVRVAFLQYGGALQLCSVQLFNLCRVRLLQRLVGFRGAAVVLGGCATQLGPFPSTGVLLFPYAGAVLPSAARECADGAQRVQHLACAAVDADAAVAAAVAAAICRRCSAKCRRRTC